MIVQAAVVEPRRGTREKGERKKKGGGERKKTGRCCRPNGEVIAVEGTVLVSVVEVRSVATFPTNFIQVSSTFLSPSTPREGEEAHVRVELNFFSGRNFEL